MSCDFDLNALCSWHRVFYDLLTEDEIKDLAKRLRIAKLLINGQTHEDIVSELHCSYATVTKVRIWLDNAGEGFKRIIKRLPQRRKVYIPKRILGFGYGLPNIIAYYISAGLKNQEKSKLRRFLQNIKGKTARDRSLKEEISSEFRELKAKRNKLE